MGLKPRQPVASTTVTIGDEEYDREALLEECEEQLERLLEERLSQGGDFAAYEKGLLEIAHEVVRRKLEKKLQSIADGFADRLWIDHDNPGFPLDQDGTRILYRRHAPGTARYHSLVGALRVRRDTYRQCSQLRATCIPLELEAGLIEHMTPAMGKSVAIGYAFMPPRQYEEFAVASGLQPPSRSTLDRVARDLGGYAATVQDDIEPLVRSNEIVDPAARCIALGLDRTAVPMRHDDWPLLPEPDERQTHRIRPKPRNRATLRGPVRWRMDYVGTVSLLDEAGNEIATRKYRLPAERDAQGIVERMLADVRHALTQRPLSIAVVQDGAPELWHLLNHALQDEPLVSEWTEVLDWYHLDERLSKCLDLCEPAKTRASQRKRWRDKLLSTDDAMSSVLRSLRRKARGLAGSMAEELRVHINYLARNKHRTCYSSYRARCIPIGSGITEGACKSVIGIRAKRSGQRWSQRGLTAALHLRSIHSTKATVSIPSGRSSVGTIELE